MGKFNYAGFHLKSKTSAVWRDLLTCAVKNINVFFFVLSENHTAVIVSGRILFLRGPTVCAFILKDLCLDLSSNTQ